MTEKVQVHRVIVEAAAKAALAGKERMRLRITVEGREYEVGVESIRECGGQPEDPGFAVPESVLHPPSANDEMPEDHICRSPIAGVVVSIAVAPGARVARGDLLLTLDAMKMYNPIHAPLDGTVGAVEVAAGQAVKPGQVLVRVE